MFFLILSFGYHCLIQANERTLAKFQNFSVSDLGCSVSTIDTLIGRILETFPDKNVRLIKKRPRTKVFYKKKNFCGGIILRRNVKGRCISSAPPFIKRLTCPVHNGTRTTFAISNFSS